MQVREYSRRRGAALGLLALALALTIIPTLQAQHPEFADLDRTVMAIPEERVVSVEALAGELDAITATDRERVRAIYRWITAHIEYDTPAFLSRDLSWMTGDEVLAARKAVCDGYSQLFADLAAHLGVEATIVRGFAKGYGYVEGRRMRTPNHAWNAVRIEGEWKLVDSTWGAGTIRNGAWGREFREYFFLTPPDRLLFTHLPENSRWQLVSRPLSRRAFFALPQVPDYLFSLGFDPAQIRYLVSQRDFGGFPGAYRHPERAIRIQDAPLVRHLDSGHPLYFQVEVPGAEQVVLTDGREWHRLRNGSGVWRGEVNLAPGSWMVYASFPGESPHVFLEYEVN